MVMFSKPEAAKQHMIDRLSQHELLKVLFDHNINSISFATLTDNLSFASHSYISPSELPYSSEKTHLDGAVFRDKTLQRQRDKDTDMFPLGFVSHWSHNLFHNVTNVDRSPRAWLTVQAWRTPMTLYISIQHFQIFLICLQIAYWTSEFVSAMILNSILTQQCSIFFSSTMF